MSLPWSIPRVVCFFFGHRWHKVANGYICLRCGSEKA